MVTKEKYLADPCRAASVPYWKSLSITVPDGMKILHGDDFKPELLELYVDEPYFRLKHDLRELKMPVMPDGFVVSGASLAEFAAHINNCYSGIGPSVAELEAYTRRPVYCPALWLALREETSGEIAASGIGEVDGDVGEGALEWIQVSPEYRGRGLGRFLVSELLWRMQDQAKFATVSGQCNNPYVPEKLYRKCGFAGNDVWHVMRKR